MDASDGSDWNECGQAFKQDDPLPSCASSLERAIRNYVDHYHEERNHQGLGNELIRGHVETELGDVEVRERLGGLLKYYRHSAA